MARVICLMFFEALIRLRMSRWLGTLLVTYLR
jgi:hypothetical protein